MGRAKKKRGKGKCGTKEAHGEEDAEEDAGEADIGGLLFCKKMPHCISSEGPPALTNLTGGLVFKSLPGGTLFLDETTEVFVIVIVSCGETIMLIS